MRQSMLKEKLRKVGHCFTKGCFIKPFKMILKKKKLQAYSQRSFHFLIFRITQEIEVNKEIIIKRNKYQKHKNYKILSKIQSFSNERNK